MTLKKLYLPLILSAVGLIFFGCGNENSKSTENAKKEILSSLSKRALRAKRYIDGLPEDQKRAFYTGTGDSSNLMANLMSSGHLEGAAEYTEVLLKIEELEKSDE